MKKSHTLWLVPSLLAVAPLAWADVAFVGVGCTYYNDTQRALVKSNNDVILISSVFQTYESKTKILLGEAGSVITKAKILGALELVAAKCTKNDSFVFFFSGHGTANLKGESFLIPEGTPALLQEEVVSYYLSLREVKKLLKTKCVAKNKLIILDACASGGKSPAPAPKPLIDADDIVVLAAARSNERAYELPNSTNSVFSKVLAEELVAARERGPVNMEFVMGRVQQRVKDVCTENKLPIQNPVFSAPQRSLILETNTIFETSRITGEAGKLFKDDLVGLQTLAMIKPGIGVVISCPSDSVSAGNAMGHLRKKLLEAGQPVFGPERSAELASVISQASTLRNSGAATSLTDRYLVTGDLEYSIRENVFQDRQVFSVTLTLRVRLMDIQGNVIEEASSDSDVGTPITVSRTTPEIARSQATKEASDRVFTKIQTAIKEREMK